MKVASGGGVKVNGDGEWRWLVEMKTSGEWRWHLKVVIQSFMWCSYNLLAHRTLPASSLSV